MKRLYLLTLFLGLSYAAIAQETNCGDGVDNDGDGFIDCFDGDCANQAACDDFYIGKDKLCQTPPTGSLLFGMKLGAASRDKTTLSYGRMAVGDLDRDGIPEMVTTHHNDKKVFILNGTDLSIKKEINTSGNPEYFDHAIANLDDDNCAEIFIVEVISSRYYVTSYDCNGNKLWSTRAYGQPFTIGLADFDYDGQVELYYKNEILDAKTGEILVAGKGDWDDYDSGPVAVDILPDGACSECAGLELVLGGEIFAVDLSPRTPGGGSVGNAIKRFNDLPGLGGIKYYPKYVTFGYVNSMTSVADYNLDGNLDVIMNGATSKSATSTTTIFFWDVANNKFKTFQPKQPNNSSWPHGTGRINLADVDGDGKMNATFVSGARIYSLKEDFTLLWQKTITEQTSGFTSTTVFDFNNDNAVEIVYRDEANLYIIDGKTGNAFTTVKCRSRTANDYPIVVDVDADGATEICVSCATNDNTNINDNNNTPFGQIRTYKSSLEPWVSARKVWNQYAYFNVNVNDDLTIPQIQQKHHLVFSSDVCGKGENRALNSFLNQSAILDSKGCKTYASADVTFVANPSLLNIVPPTCPDQDFLVSFSLQNIGDIDLNGDFPISFYNGDPRLAGATKLKTTTIKFTNFKIGDQLDVPDIAVSGTGGTFTLFAVLNDAGTTVPTPIKLPNSGFDECNFSNNVVSATVIPRAFQLSTSSTNHVQCGAGPSPPNGSARAFKPEGANETTVGYTFYWFDGTTAGAPGAADHVGSQINNLANGTYTVYAINNAFQCGSDTVQVVVGQESLSIGATVNVDKPYTNCNNPDGQLSVTPASGVVGDYDFEWFEGTVFGTTPSLSDSSVLRFTKALTYSVLVTQISSGCETLVSGTVPDETVTPVVTTAFTPANCAPAASGQASATIGGVTAGYTFYWYDGSTSKPTEDFLGAAYPNVTAGNYTVIAKSNATGCNSNETVVTVPTVTGITVAATITAQQTSCTTPNGAASANVGGTTAGYTFRWFEGNSTVTEIGTSAIITGLAAGDYTVEATNVVTGCVDTELITIVDNILIPTVTPSVVANQTHCFPANGAVTATAAGSPGPYVYYWFEGNIGTPDTTVADFKGANYAGVTAGFYTVVAVDKNTRCGSARGLIEVLDQTVSPIVSTSTIGQTSCDVAIPNGSASANVGGVTAGFRFRWFTGADTTNFILENPALPNRVAGTYTVKAINRTTGCFTTKLVVINDISAKPTLSLVKQDNTICSGSIGFTGSVTASFATNPNVQAGDTYTYEWKKDGAIIIGETAATLSGVDAGTYSVTVKSQKLGCVSDPSSIVVNDVVDLPVVTSANIASTNCDLNLPNGSAQVVTVDGVAVGGTADYTYQWHTGIGTGTPIPVGTNASADDAMLTGVQGGVGFDYTVLVTNTLTGCSSTAVVNVADGKVLPELSLTTTPNSICDPVIAGAEFNGTVTAAVDNIGGGALADYVFTFGGGMNAGITNGNVYEELNGGPTAYTAFAEHTPTGCVSPTVNIQVANATDIPDLLTSSIASTDCDMALANGEAHVVSVDGNPATTTGYTFAWTGPAGFSIATNPTRTEFALTNVQGGAGFDYTVLVTNLSNGCNNTAVVNVADARILPALSLTTTPNSICDPVIAGTEFNGTVTAAVDNIGANALSDYVFTFGAGMNAGVTNGNVYEELNGGPTAYTVFAEHTPTGCLSPTASIQVANATDIPDLLTSSVASTDCDVLLANGEAHVVTVDGNPATTTGYTFVWTGPAGYSVALNPTRTAFELEGVQGGAGFDYSVLVTNLSNGCTNTAIVNVADAKILPALSLTTTPNTICDPAIAGTPFDGTMTAAVDNIGANALSDYVFTFGGGMNAGVTNGNVYEQLNGGPTAYTVFAKHTPTGCVSSTVSTQVANAQNIPDLLMNSLPSTNCDMTLANGEAHVVSVDGNPATTTGFTFAWTGPAGFSVGTNSTKNLPELEMIQGGAGFDYTVLVTNQSNGCNASALVNVADDKEIPALTLTAVPNTICDPSKAVLGGGAFDGQVSAALNAVGNYAGSVVGDFNFSWNTGLAGVGQNVLSNLDMGSYTVTAVHTATGCQTAPHSAQVTSAQVLPVITMSSTPSQNCVGGAPDGIATVTNVVPNGKNYDYRWFDGNSTSGNAGPVNANTTLTTDSYSNVQGGINGVSMYEYTVEVTILQTGCINTGTVAVADDSEVPVLGPLAGVDNTLCSVVKNGSATISTLNYRGSAVAPASFGDFDFVWSGGTQGPVETITALAAGNYSLTVRNIAHNCISNPVSVTIDDDLFFPQIDVASVDQTSCDPGNPNGALTATVDASAIGGGAGQVAGYTFTWVDDVTTVATSSNAIANLRGNQSYTITVVRDATQCSSVQAVFLDESLTIPTVTVNVSDMTVCAPANGELTASLLPATTYYWYNGSDASDVQAVIDGADFTGGRTYSGLVPGEYTLVVEDDATKCRSEQVISAVGDASPEILPVVANTLIPASCNVLGGTLDAAVQTVKTTFNGLSATNEITTSAPLTGLAPGDQIIISRNGALALPIGLDEDKVYFIETINATFDVITLSATLGGPQISLTADGDGFIADFVPGGYTYEWYSGIPSPTDASLGSINYFTNPPLFSGGPLPPGGATLSNVGTGIYTVQVIDPTTGCKNYLSHTLPFVGSHAVIKIKKTNSTICPNTVGNGSIEIQIENPSGAPLGTDQNSYLTTLYRGGVAIVGPYSPGPGFESAPFIIPAALAPDSYTVEVRENYSGNFCAISQEVIIGADALKPVISLASNTSNTACDPNEFDGQIDISVAKDPNDLTAPGVTYNILMAPDPNGVFPLNGQPIGTYPATDLGPGTYTFTVNASTGCTAVKSFTVLDNPTKSQLTAANITVTNAEYCDVTLEQSAAVLINQLNVIGGGAEDLTDYRFDWFTDATMSTPIYSGMGDPGATKGGEHLSNVGAPLPTSPVTNGAYWVVATKINDLSGTGGIGCSSTPYNLNISSKKVLPQITLTPFGDGSCDPTVFEGSLQVDVTTASGPGNGGTYAYTWLPQGGAGQPTNSAGNNGLANVYNNINDGTYQVTAVNEVTGCSNTLGTTIMKIAPPVFTLNALATELTNCATFDGRIDNLQVFVDGVGGNVADFDYVWFKSDLQPASVVLNGKDATVPVDNELTSATYPLIALDKYFVKAIRKAGGDGIGCESAPLRKDILDGRIYPQLDFATVSSTACDDNFDGRITVTANTASGPGFGAGYNFVWTDDPDHLVGTDFSASNSATNNTASPFATANTDLIGEGLYTIRVTNFVTQCFTDGSVSVARQSIPTEIVSVTPTHVDQCAPLLVNGSGTVTAVNVSGAPGNTADFSYTWADNAGMALPFVENDPLLTQGGLDVGTYYMIARRNAVASPATPGVTGSGCATSPVPFTVLDHRITPTISFATISSTACDDNFDGRITVTANTASGPGFGAGYNFVWTDDPDHLVGTDFSASNSATNNTASPFATANTDLIGEGLYKIRVTNFATQCFTDGSVSVARQSIPTEIASVTATHVDQCAPLLVNGSGTVTAVNVSGAPGNTTDFSYTWANNAGMATPFVTNDPLLTQGGLDVGTYYVIARRNAVVSPATPGVTGSGCATSPVPFKVLDHRITPTISFATISSTACDDNFDGRITVTANTASGPGFGAGYNFVWTDDPDHLVGTDFSASNSATNNTASPFATANTDLIGEGLYTIRVTNFVTQCFTDGSVSVARQSIPTEIVSVTPTHVDQCAPLLVNGSGTVTAVNVSGGPGNTTDFSFTWADNAGMALPFVENDPLLTQGGLDVGTYYVIARRNAVASPATPGATGSGCATSPVPFTVLDHRITPTISFATISSTACDDNFDGRITVTANTASGPGFGAGYNFVWTDDPDGLAGTSYTVSNSPNNTPGPYSTQAGDLVGPGPYAIRVTNFATQCYTDGSVTLQQNTLPVEILTASATPQQMCTTPGDGSVGVALADVRVGGNPVGAGITFAWTDENGNAIGAGTSVANLNAGSYIVQATRTAGLAPASGCVSAPLTIVVEDDRQYPVLGFSTIANTTCNDTFDGQITLTATTAGIGNASNYDIDWTDNPGGAVVIANALNVASPYTTSAADNIGVGDYTVTVTNTLTNCASDGAVSVLQNTTPVQIWDVTKIDQRDCAPFDGSITIDTNDPTHVSVTGPYTFAWEKGGVALTPVPDNILSGVDGGVYTVTGTKASGIGAGCVTNPFQITLLDLTEKPVLELQAIRNFACDPALANGQVSAIIFEGNSVASPADFNLQWFAGKNTTVGPVLGTNDVLPNQVQGDYTLIAVDNASPNRGCSNVATTAIGFDATTFSVTIASTDQDLCAPAQNGSVSVTGLTEVRNGVSTPAANLGLFGFQWSDQAGTPHPSTPTYVNGASALNNLLAGKYMVRVQNALGCTSTATAGIVEDLTVLPVISLDDYLNPAVCILPETGGYLQVSADNSLNFADYVFEWFEGPDDTGALVEPNNAELANVQYNQPLEYTVRVRNIATHCVNMDTYKFGVDTVQIHVLASAVSRKNCLVDDGNLFATTLDGTAALYNYEWYAGPTATGVPVFTTKEVTGAPIGQYTVIAVNPNHSFCTSTPYTTRVTDGRVMPNVVAIQRNPLTYCDPANPNGVAFATVNNDVVGFTFDWFQGSVGGAPIYTGPEVTGLTATTYAVRATDVLTGCENTASITIDNSPVNVAEPTVVVASHRTNCVDPDGVLSASVNGNTSDYLLQWYDGNSVKAIVDETGEFYRDLAEGLYTTTARDNESGCVSDPVVTEVLPFREDPDFDIVTVPTNCEQNIGEATLILNNDVDLFSVEWDIAGDVQFGTMLSDLPKGEFTVRATTYQECFTEKTFVVRPEVLVFNGVSRNNDGQNDYFEIACIQDFPNNNVKIFNRAGTLVYEANGYDNQDVLFDGVSNRGINLLGTDLPDGTYFYIIDKRDGSEPRTGYLELLR